LGGQNLRAPFSQVAAAQKTSGGDLIAATVDRSSVHTEIISTIDADGSVGGERAADAPDGDLANRTGKRAM
jgi:hypothetical protein